jgi:hypothetical protein
VVAGQGCLSIETFNPHVTISRMRPDSTLEFCRTMPDGSVAHASALLLRQCNAKLTNIRQHMAVMQSKEAAVIQGRNDASGCRVFATTCIACVQAQATHPQVIAVVIWKCFTYAQTKSYLTQPSHILSHRVPAV